MMLFVCIEAGLIMAWLRLRYLSVGLNCVKSLNWLFFDKSAWFLSRPKDVPLLGKLRPAKAFWTETGAYSDTLC
jgi:hypothetical protein